MRKITKKISLFLAVFQLFSLSSSAEEDTFVLIKEPYKYQRLDNKTNEYKTISIFDYENIKSSQYGANQLAFKNNFDVLINNSDIWKEVQSVFPLETFDSIDEAMFFYQKYFEIIYDNGCGYAAAANYVFRLFEGKEEEFYKIFGYPMYTIRDNSIDFNYEVFMLKFFNYSIEITNKKDKIFKSFARDFYEFKLFNYLRTIEKEKRQRKSIKLTDEEWKKQKQEEIEEENTLRQLKMILNNTQNEKNDFSIRSDASFAYIYNFLGDNYGIIIDVHLKNDMDEPHVDEIIASSGFTLTKLNPDGSIGKTQEIDDHYTYITELNDNQIIVSSWGKMYILDNKNAVINERIQFKLSK